MTRTACCGRLLLALAASGPCPAQDATELSATETTALGPRVDGPVDRRLAARGRAEIDYGGGNEPDPRIRHAGNIGFRGRSSGSPRSLI